MDESVSHFSYTVPILCKGDDLARETVAYTRWIVTSQEPDSYLFSKMNTYEPPKNRCDILKHANIERLQSLSKSPGKSQVKSCRLLVPLGNKLRPLSLPVTISPGDSLKCRQVTKRGRHCTSINLIKCTCCESFNNFYR